MNWKFVAVSRSNSRHVWNDTNSPTLTQIVPEVAKAAALEVLKRYVNEFFMVDSIAEDAARYQSVLLAMEQELRESKA